MYHFISYIFLLLSLWLIKWLPLVHSTSDNPQLTFDQLYKDGVNSYLDNNWASCISYLELALEDWNWWNNNINKCRKNCYEEADTVTLIFPEKKEFEIDRFFEKLVLNTLCITRCKHEVFGSRIEKDIPEDLLNDFKYGKPYDYLQLCYFKHGQLDKAANAAATVLVKQPNHEVMQNNLKYYVEMGGLDVNDVVNIELKEYGKEYIKGVREYESGNYNGTVEHLEKCLESLMEALIECRMGCESPFDQGWFPEFVASISNHYTFTLRCKLNCMPRLSNLYGQEIENFFPLIFNYLQYSYFQIGNLAKSCEAVGSYLVLDPEDPSQVRNQEFLWTQDGVKEEFFKPRQIVVDFNERQSHESGLLSFIESSFGFAAGLGKLQDDPPPSVSPPGSIADTLLKMVQSLAGSPGATNPNLGQEQFKDEL